SPTLTTKSCWLPGAADIPAPARSLFLLAQAAMVTPAATAAANFVPRTRRMTVCIPVLLLASTQMTHRQPQPVVSLPSGLAVRSLNERSVNLDGAFPRSRKLEESPQRFSNG